MPESAVYTPKDGDNWMLAKLNVQITDIGYAQMAEHLARVKNIIWYTEQILDAKKRM